MSARPCSSAPTAPVRRPAPPPRHRATGARVVIVGGGGTGAAIAYDCVLRGYRVLLLERGSLTCGTTGRHHGLLHSGARYVGTDLQAATECWAEAQILRRITDGVIEDNGGYFVAVAGHDDDDYRERFVAGCQQAGIPIRAVDRAELAAAAPALTPHVAAAYAVPDAGFDAWRLPMQFFTSAMAQGAIVRQFCEVTDIEVEQGAVAGVCYRDHTERRDRRVAADVVVNAAGVWAPRIAALCAITVAVRAQMGAMVAVRGRMCNHILNRLAPAGDGDIVVPQRAMTIIGTTSNDCDDVDVPEVSPQEICYLQRRADELLPGFSRQSVQAAWAAVRPLAGAIADDPRRISRKLVYRNHRHDGTRGFFSIIGGKATTLRIMAEELVNEIDRDTGSGAPCATADRPLLPFQEFYAYYTSDKNDVACW